MPERFCTRHPRMRLDARGDCEACEREAESIEWERGAGTAAGDAAAERAYERYLDRPWGDA